MDICENCKHYDSTNTYSHTGVCEMWDIYVKEHDAACDEYEDSE